MTNKKIRWIFLFVGFLHLELSARLDYIIGDTA
jgi:hypothetical protein